MSRSESRTVKPRPGGHDAIAHRQQAQIRAIHSEIELQLRFRQPNPYFMRGEPPRLALTEIGVKETETNVRNKIARGGFTAVFFVQCLVAIGCNVLRLED